MNSSTIELLKGPGGALPKDIWTCLPPLLQTACGYFDMFHEREAFLHGSLPVLSRICENVIVPLRDLDHRLAIQVYVTGESASGKGCAGFASTLLDVISETEAERRRVEMAKWHALEPNEEGEKPPEPMKHDMRISLRSTPNTWVREMRKNPPGIVHVFTDTEGDTLKSGGHKDHGSVRSLVKKGFAGEQADFTTKEDGTMQHRLWLSAMVSSTPQQLIEAMNGDSEDGFANRYVYHMTPSAGSIYKSPFLPLGQEKPESIQTKLYKMGYEVQSMHDRQRQRNPETPLKVTFTQDQMASSDKSGQEKLSESVDIHPHLGGYCKRMHSVVLRTAALFAVLRANPSSHDTHLQCDELSWNAARILREHWFETMIDAFAMVTPQAHKTDMRMTIPEDVRKLVCEWRLDNIMPAAAVAKLQTMGAPHVKHWLKGLDNPADAVGKVQRRYMKELSRNVQL